MPVPLAYRVYQLVWEALDWLFPPVCGGCSSPGGRWCSDCSRKTIELNSAVCAICGNPGVSPQPCSRCLSSRPAFTALRSYAAFSGPIREAIHKLKYRRDIGLGEILAHPMINSLEKLNWPLDMITSVPLGLARFKERGYNQANLLARPIGLYFHIPFSSHILMRAKETRTQVGLTVTERHENMAGAIRTKKDIVHGRNILVVDDVATSGATFQACAQALFEAGASHVYCFSLARAVFTPGGEIDLA